MRAQVYETNLIGSAKLLNVAINHLHNVKCFIFTSSAAVYGIHGLRDTPFQEDTDPQPRGPFAISKHAFEMDLQSATRTFGMPHIIFRLHNVFGPNQHRNDSHAGVVGIFMNRVHRGQHIRVYGDGRQTRQFTYVRDVAAVVAQGPLFAAAYNETFNVGSDKSYTVNEVATSVQRALGVDAAVSSREYVSGHRHGRGDGDPQHVACSHEKLRHLMDPARVPHGAGLDVEIAATTEAQQQRTSAGNEAQQQRTSAGNASGGGGDNVGALGGSKSLYEHVLGTYKIMLKHNRYVFIMLTTVNTTTLVYHTHCWCILSTTHTCGFVFALLALVEAGTCATHHVC